MLRITWLFVPVDLRCASKSDEGDWVDDPMYSDEAVLADENLPVLREGTCDWIPANHRVDFGEIAWGDRQGMEELSFSLSRIALPDGTTAVGLFHSFHYGLSDGRVIDETVLVGRVVNPEDIASRWPQEGERPAWRDDWSEQE